MVIGEFPSAEAAWEFTEEARASGHRVKLTDTARPVAKRSFGTAVVSALVLGSLFGVLGAYAEAGVVGLPRLEPLFAAPVGAVGAFLAAFGGSLGALLGGLATLKPAQRHAAAVHYSTMEGTATGLKRPRDATAAPLSRAKGSPKPRLHSAGRLPVARRAVVVRTAPPRRAGRPRSRRGGAADVVWSGQRRRALRADQVRRGSQGRHRQSLPTDSGAVESRDF